MSAFLMQVFNQFSPSFVVFIPGLMFLDVHLQLHKAYIDSVADSVKVGDGFD